MRFTTQDTRKRKECRTWHPPSFYRPNRNKTEIITPTFAVRKPQITPRSLSSPREEPQLTAGPTSAALRLLPTACLEIVTKACLMRGIKIVRWHIGRTWAPEVVHGMLCQLAEHGSRRRQQPLSNRASYPSWCPPQLGATSTTCTRSAVSRSAVVSPTHRGRVR